MLTRPYHFYYGSYNDDPATSSGNDNTESESHNDGLMMTITNIDYQGHMERCVIGK